MKKIILITLFILSTLFINSCCIFYDENLGYTGLKFSIVYQNGEDIFKQDYYIDSLKICKLDSPKERDYLQQSQLNDDGIHINLMYVYFSDKIIGKTYLDNYLINLGNNNFDTLQLIYSMYEDECGSPYPGEIIAFYNNILYTSNSTSNLIFEFTKTKP